MRCWLGAARAVQAAGLPANMAALGTGLLMDPQDLSWRHWGSHNLCHLPNDLGHEAVSLPLASIAHNRAPGPQVSEGAPPSVRSIKKFPLVYFELPQGLFLNVCFPLFLYIPAHLQPFSGQQSLVTMTDSQGRGVGTKRLTLEPLTPLHQAWTSSSPVSACGLSCPWPGPASPIHPPPCDSPQGLRFNCGGRAQRGNKN